MTMGGKAVVNLRRTVESMDEAHLPL